MSEQKLQNSLKINKQVLFIIFLVIFTQTVHGFYAIYEKSPPGAFVLIGYFLMFWLVGDWFMKDSKKNNVSWVFDMGFFLYLSWPLLIPFYLYKTRGFKSAAAVTLGFVLLYFGIFFISGFSFYYFLPEQN